MCQMGAAGWEMGLQVSLSSAGHQHVTDWFGSSSAGFDCSGDVDLPREGTPYVLEIGSSAGVE